MVRSHLSGVSVLKGRKPSKKTSRKEGGPQVKPAERARATVADKDRSSDFKAQPRRPRVMDEMNDICFESLIDGTEIGLSFDSTVREFSSYGDIAILYSLRWWQPDDLDVLAADIRRMADHRRKILASP